MDKVTGSTQSENATVRTADGKELTASRGVVVATEGPAAQKLLGQALELSPSHEGAPKGTCNLYFRQANAGHISGLWWGSDRLMLCLHQQVCCVMCLSTPAPVSTSPEP